MICLIVYFLRKNCIIIFLFKISQSLYFFLSSIIRDYASTGGFFRNIRSNLKLEGEEDDDKYDEDLYSVYIDVTKPYHDKGRFFTGLLIDDSKADMKQRLLEKNANKSEKKLDDETDEQFERLDYVIGDLPSVRSAVASFPWTDGFVSGILNNYKVFPALHKYAKENLPEGSKFVVSTTCSRKKQMCTFYIPMIQQKDFLLGHKDSLEYEGYEEDQTMIDFELLWSDLKRILTFKWINY